LLPLRVRTLTTPPVEPPYSTVYPEDLTWISSRKPVTSALSSKWVDVPKIERGHAKDLADVEQLIGRGLVEPARLRELYGAIEPRLLSLPGDRPAVVSATDRGDPGPAMIPASARRGV
jgi:hypothetical protein